MSEDYHPNNPSPDPVFPNGVEQAKPENVAQQINGIAGLLNKIDTDKPLTSQEASQKERVINQIIPQLKKSYEKASQVLGRLNDDDIRECFGRLILTINKNTELAKVKQYIDFLVTLKNSDNEKLKKTVSNSLQTVMQQLLEQFDQQILLTTKVNDHNNIVQYLLNQAPQGSLVELIKKINRCNSNNQARGEWVTQLQNYLICSKENHHLLINELIAIEDTQIIESCITSLSNNANIRKKYSASVSASVSALRSIAQSKLLSDQLQESLNDCFSEINKIKDAFFNDVSVRQIINAYASIRDIYSLEQQEDVASYINQSLRDSLLTWQEGELGSQVYDIVKPLLKLQARVYQLKANESQHELDKQRYLIKKDFCAFSDGIDTLKQSYSGLKDYADQLKNEIKTLNSKLKTKTEPDNTTDDISLPSYNDLVLTSDNITAQAINDCLQHQSKLKQIKHDSQQAMRVVKLSAYTNDKDCQQRCFDQLALQQPENADPEVVADYTDALVRHYDQNHAAHQKIKGKQIQSNSGNTASKHQRGNVPHRYMMSNNSASNQMTHNKDHRQSSRRQQWIHRFSLGILRPNKIRQALKNMFKQPWCGENKQARRLLEVSPNVASERVVQLSRVKHQDLSVFFKKGWLMRSKLRDDYIHALNQQDKQGVSYKQQLVTNLVKRINAGRNDQQAKQTLDQLLLGGWFNKENDFVSNLNADDHRNIAQTIAKIEYSALQQRYLDVWLADDNQAQKLKQQKENDQALLQIMRDMLNSQQSFKQTHNNLLDNLINQLKQKLEQHNKPQGRTENQNGSDYSSDYSDATSQSIDKSQSNSDEYNESSKSQQSLSQSISAELKSNEKQLKKALGSRRYKQLSQLSSLFTQETEEINPDASNQLSNKN